MSEVVVEEVHCPEPPELEDQACGVGERCGADHHVADRHRPRSPVTLNFIKITQSI